MMKKIAFIGCGNMGEAMLAGILKEGWARPEAIQVHTYRPTRMAQLKEVYGIEIATSNQAAADGADLIVLAVKPKLYGDILATLGPRLAEKQVVCGIAPAYSICAIRRALATDRGWIARAMPNTPALVGAGISGFCLEAEMPAEQAALSRGFFEAFGEAIEVSEDLMAAVGSVAGSAPAFIYMVMEAMTQAGIGLGLSAEQAQAFAASTVAGSAKMLQSTGEHPARLRDQVSSAGGTTIAGVNSLEKSAFKGSLISAMEASAERFREMEAEISKQG